DGADNDAIGGRSAEYHAEVAAAFRALADADPASFVIVDGDGSTKEVHDAILEALETRLGKLPG
ncbi:MAG: thymidylate kinase, partial [Pseudomonadota bacterium]